MNDQRTSYISLQQESGTAQLSRDGLLHVKFVLASQSFALDNPQHLFCYTDTMTQVTVYAEDRLAASCRTVGGAKIWNSEIWSCNVDLETCKVILYWKSLENQSEFCTNPGDNST